MFAIADMFIEAPLKTFLSHSRRRGRETTALRGLAKPQSSVTAKAIVTTAE
jgi:hypothetical protein